MMPHKMDGVSCKNVSNTSNFCITNKLDINGIKKSYIIHNSTHSIFKTSKSAYNEIIRHVNMTCMRTSFIIQI